MELKPIAAVRIGCVVEDGGAMHGTVLDRSAKITALTSMEQIECSMSGESDLVYTSQTNQTSASMSGSYGVRSETFRRRLRLCRLLLGLQQQIDRV